MRRMKAKDTGAAATSVNECTMTVHEYPDPRNPNLIYYDLPGVGTPNFPRDQYLTEIRKRTMGNIEFHDFDFFFIASCSRFTEDDTWLAAQITNRNKTFYFIRTKLDIDLRNTKEDDPDTYDEEKVIEGIRMKCEDELKKMAINNRCNENKSEFKIFLVSGRFHDYDKWDFPKMMKSLLEDWPKLKRQAIICSITNNSEEVIRQKAHFLRGEIWKIACCSGAVGAIPIPGTSIAADLYIMYRCYGYYKKAFGLDDESLTTLANTHNITKAAIDAYVSSTVWAGLFVSGQATTFLITEAAEEGSKQVAQKAASELATTALKFIPLLGNGAAAAISFGATYHRLYYLINKMEEAAIAVLQFVIKQSIDSA